MVSNQLIFDVGMHKGEDTDYYLKKGFRVVAFEANPDMVLFCKERFKEALAEGRLVIVEGAIVDFDKQENGGVETVKFYRNKDVSVWGTVATDWASRNEQMGTNNEMIEVRAVNFTECLSKFGIPYYLKIDIEGMDVVCLKSLSHFDKKPAYVSIESEKESFGKLKEEFEYFRINGYESFKLVNQASIELQKEPLKSEENKCLGFSFEHGSSGLFGLDLPGKWYSRAKAIWKYRMIFLGYKLFGDAGIVKNHYLKVVSFRFLKLFSKQPVPGWFDTHARHKSVG